METLAIITDNKAQIELKEAGAAFLAAANELVIEDDKKYAYVIDAIKAIKLTGKQVEEAFKAQIEEANAELLRKVQQLTAENAELRERLDAAVACIKKADKNCNHVRCAVKEWRGEGE